MQRRTFLQATGAMALFAFAPRRFTEALAIGAAAAIVAVTLSATRRATHDPD
ncbi:MAG: hypothetical protein H0U92_08090 [Actinobacteria bacterium]|nr:hypothetical protein [Actinomycetota bacterium]